MTTAINKLCLKKSELNRLTNQTRFVADTISKMNNNVSSGNHETEAQKEKMGRMARTVHIYLVFYADVISQGFVTGYTKPRERVRGRFPVHWPLMATELLSFTGYY